MARVAREGAAAPHRIGSGEGRRRWRFKGKARRNAKGRQLGFGLTAKDGRGLSVYRAGSRVQIGYRVLAADGEELARGHMNYG